MSDESKPVHVSLTVFQSSGDPRTSIVVGGVDLTQHCRGFKVHASVGAVPAVWLDLIGVSLDIQAEVPADYVQEMTLEEDLAHRVAQQTVDAERGLKMRQPHALLAVSLGTKPGAR